MALPFNRIDFTLFGGGNWNDQSGALVGRSHEQVEGGFAPRFPVESPNMLNMDFVDRALGKRKGSAALDDYSSVLISGDTILKETTWVIPGTTTNVQISVGAKGIYTNQSGSWARMTNANGTAFQWPTDATKASFVEVDNHLMIMADNNYSQVYRTGAALDDQANNQTTTTTVDADSNSGQKVLNVAATTMFAVGDRIDIDPTGAGGGQEFGFIASISAGVSVTMEDNLTNTHTAAQADTVQVANRYTEAKGGASQLYTGAWTQGHYIGFALHQRWVMSKGDSIAEFSDVSQPWDLAGGGFYQANGNIVGAVPWVPRGISELNAVAFFSTTGGPEFTSGFDASDTISPLGIGATALNHQCIATLDNWIVYLTTEGGIEGVNFNEVIDLGRRYKTLDGATGPMDTFDPTNSAHATKPFAFTNRDKKQVGWFYPDASNTTNSHALVLDVFLGEPVAGEPKESFERRVRCLYWAIDTPSTNPWFVSVYARLGSLVGVLATGITYTMESGLNDLGTLAIASFWETPDFAAGIEDQEKNWRRLAGVFQEKGDWNVTRRRFLDYSADQSGTDFDYGQLASSTLWGGSTWDGGTWAGTATVSSANWEEVYSKAIRFRLFNENISEDWVLRALTLEYQIAARSD